MKLLVLRLIKHRVTHSACFNRYVRRHRNYRRRAKDCPWIGSTTRHARTTAWLHAGNVARSLKRISFAYLYSFNLKSPPEKVKCKGKGWGASIRGWNLNCRWPVAPSFLRFDSVSFSLFPTFTTLCIFVPRPFDNPLCSFVSPARLAPFKSVPLQVRTIIYSSSRGLTAGWISSNNRFNLRIYYGYRER